MREALPNRKNLYKALLRKDTHFDGIFFAGIRTTGIFCRPTCRARKPKPENVEYFSTAREALLSGYRPCKLCNPLGVQGEVPEWLRPVLGALGGDSAIRIPDSDLREWGIEPSRVRRWFKKNYGMTFHAYMRGIRIGGALRQIQLGDKVIEAAFDSGYESLSGFSEAFKRATSISPRRSKEVVPIVLMKIPTPLGPMLAGATGEGVCLLEFADRRMLKTQLARLQKLMPGIFLPGTNHHLEHLERQLKEYFAADRKEFEVPLIPQGTPFQQKVWAFLRTIPYGETISYKKQAERMGNANSIRAVGGANGDNPIAIVIPCHRVIGENGQLRGYGGGLPRKKYLLDLESGRLNVQE